LAVCVGGKSKNQRYDDAESIARKNKFGLWKYNLNLNAVRGETEKEFKPVSFTKNLVLL
jgi:endonuclease YncB( thermonuclease family)